MRSATSSVNVIVASLFLPPSCLASPFYVPPASITSASQPEETPGSNVNAAAEAAADAVTPACTTLHRFGGFKLGLTSTVYTTTTTETVSVDCGTGCSSVDVDNFGGHGPVAMFETTITVQEATTTTEFVCGTTARTAGTTDLGRGADGNPEASVSMSSGEGSGEQQEANSGSFLGLAVDVAAVITGEQEQQ